MTVRLRNRLKSQAFHVTLLQTVTAKAVERIKMNRNEWINGF